MTTSIPQILFLHYIIIAFIFSLGANVCIHGKTLKGNHIEMVRSNGTVKTIMSEAGDIIDCVDILKQPAFDHPFLKNHSTQDLKQKLNSYSKKFTTKFLNKKVYQTWHNGGRCPQGTIPIRRTKDLPNYKISSLSTRLGVGSNPSDGHEYAIVKTSLGTYYGGHARFNVWNPQPELQEFSLAQMWIYSRTVTGNGVETIEVGWQVYPQMYGDGQTRFFILWTNNNYRTYCYNLLCPGFVQTNRNIALGGAITTSTYGGAQSLLELHVFKDATSGDWILMLNNYGMIGYWPFYIFNTLAISAAGASWGGEILNFNTMRHTSTPMGSGYFPSIRNLRASYFDNLRVIDASGNMMNPDSVFYFASNPGCYEVEVVSNELFYYGGPGYSTSCP